MNTCAGCDTTWTGLAVAHCAACHLTFGSVAGFDKHRVSGRCRSEYELTALGMAPNPFGRWRFPMSLDALSERAS